MEAGLKPNQIAKLLSIGEQKLRYWREKLDPNPYRSEFSVPDLLAFRIIKMLIEKRNFSSQQLEQYKLIDLFVWCHETSNQQIAQTTLIINSSEFSFQFQHGKVEVDLDDFEIHTIRLKTIIETNTIAVLSMGCDNWRNRIIDKRHTKTHLYSSN
jgi:hypothetical protein